MERPTIWAEADSGDDTALAATHTGVAGFRHFISGLSISASAAPATAIAVQVLSGATVLDHLIVPAGAFAPIVINYDHPLRCADGEDAIVTMEAAGSGVTQVAVVRGFTVQGG